jgi:hypothetical protein
MLYLIRDTDGLSLAFTFKGVLSLLPLCAPDAAVYTITGRWIAGRRVRG